MTDFSTWGRATLEQFAQEATDKLVAMAEAQPVAWTVPFLITDFSRDFSMYKTKTYTRPLYAHPPTSDSFTPEGWQLVPVALDMPMRTVLADSFNRASKGECFMFDDFWTEFLAAAPKQKETE